MGFWVLKQTLLSHLLSVVDVVDLIGKREKSITLMIIEYVTGVTYLQLSCTYIDEYECKACRPTVQNQTKVLHSRLH